MRTFIPSKPDSTVVKKWTYTRSGGLKCHYKNGDILKSGWTMKELLNADHTKGDGLPAVEVFDVY